MIFLRYRRLSLCFWLKFKMRYSNVIWNAEFVEVIFESHFFLFVYTPRIVYTIYAQNKSLNSSCNESKLFSIERKIKTIWMFRVSSWEWIIRWFCSNLLLFMAHFMAGIHLEFIFLPYSIWTVTTYILLTFNSAFQLFYFHSFFFAHSQFILFIFFLHSLEF